MSMKSDFEQIIRSYGHDIFLQRKNNDLYSETLEVHTVRYDSAVGQLSNAQVEAEEGIVNTTIRQYYFLASSKPFEGDRIYEQEPEAPSGQSVWLIDATVPMRGENGSIVYYSCGTTRIIPN